MNSFYNEEELIQLGFRKYGNNIKISKKCSIYGASNMEFGSNIRIDDFCILSGNIKIGNNVHISAYTALYGGGGIEIGNYCGCSPRTTIFSATDDFSGEYMIGPMNDEKHTNVIKGKVIMKNYSQLGASTIVMPNVTISEGTVTGCFTFVKRSLESWKVYAGNPAKIIKNRSDNLKKYI